MDLILWRHADADDSSPDMARALTEKGQKQAAQMALWLRAHLPKGTRILVSPATRAQQTALALTEEFQTVRELAPGASYASVLAAAGWPDAKGTVLVVGHQPTLGHVAALLLTGEPGEWSVKKGAIYWLTNRARAEQSQVVLKAALSPDMA